MDIVTRILGEKEETPIMIHSKSNLLGERIHIFGRFGLDVKLNGNKIITELTGDSLYGVKNYLERDKIIPELFQKGIGDMWLPNSYDKTEIKLFELALGENAIKNYLISINQWDTRGNFKTRLNDQMVVAKAFGRNRRYI